MSKDKKYKGKIDTTKKPTSMEQLAIAKYGKKGTKKQFNEFLSGMRRFNRGGKV